MVPINPMPRLLLAQKPRVLPEVAARVPAQEAEVAMALAVQRDAMAARLTTTVSTRLRTVVLPASYRAPGPGLRLLILSLLQYLKKRRHRLSLRLHLLMEARPRSLPVKIAGQRSHHFGAGMSMDTPYAMLAVRPGFFSPSFFHPFIRPMANTQQVCITSFTVAIARPP